MKRRIAGEGTIFQDKNGRWIARNSYWVEEDGKRKRRYLSGTGHTPQQALQRLQVNTSNALTERPKARATKPKLSELLNEWLEHLAVSETTQATTRQRHRRAVETYLIGKIGDIPVDNFTAEIAQELFNETLKNETPYRRVNAYKASNALMNWLVRQGKISTNPLTTVPTPQAPKSTQLKREDRLIEATTRILTNLLKHLKDGGLPNRAHLYLPIKLQMTLGLRTGELLGLTSDCFQNLGHRTKTQTVTIQQQLAYGEGDEKHLGLHIKPTTKTKRSRVIPLPRDLAKELDEHIKNKPKPAGAFQDLIFLNPSTNAPYHPKKWSTQINDLLAEYLPPDYKAQGKPLKIRAHMIRHISATLLFEAGIPLETAKEILGHSSDAMTLYYTHQTTSKKKEATEAVSNLLT